MRAFETPERLLTLGGGERYKKSYPVPDDLLINRRSSAPYRVSRNSICLTHARENAHIARTRVIMHARMSANNARALIRTRDLRMRIYSIVHVRRRISIDT